MVFESAGSVIRWNRLKKDRIKRQFEFCVIQYAVALSVTDRADCRENDLVSVGLFLKTVHCLSDSSIPHQ